MLPISLDHERIRVLVVGEGVLLERRLVLLKSAGILDLKVFVTGPGAPVLGAQQGLPDAEDLKGANLLFIAGVDRKRIISLVAKARSLGVLVNTEDDRELCDFHVPAMLRRGDLLISISTGGGSPGLSRRLRKRLESDFGPEWEGRVEELSAARLKWRDEGLDLAGIAQKSDEYIESRGWLK